MTQNGGKRKIKELRLPDSLKEWMILKSRLYAVTQVLLPKAGTWVINHTPCTLHVSYTIIRIV